MVSESRQRWSNNDEPFTPRCTPLSDTVPFACSGERRQSAPPLFCTGRRWGESYPAMTRLGRLAEMNASRVYARTSYHDMEVMRTHIDTVVRCPRAKPEQSLSGSFANLSVGPRTAPRWFPDCHCAFSVQQSAIQPSNADSARRVTGSKNTFQILPPAVMRSARAQTRV